MSNMPFMPLYIDNYVGDTQHLSTEQHGAYMLLLMAMWKAGGRLPSDPAKLARIARLPRAKWVKIADDLLAFFDEAGGEITQKRLVSELQKASEKHAKRVDAGSRGGTAKALKEKEMTTSNAIAKPCHSLDITSSLRSERGHADQIQIDEEFDTFWAAYPRREGSNPKAPALQSYRRCRKRGISAEMILDGARRYARQVAGEPPRFTAQATTWLNQSRWEQESAPLLPVKPADPLEWTSMRASDPSDWPPSLPPFSIVAKAYTAGNWASAWGPEPDYGGCRLSIDLQRRLAVERFGEDVARRRSPRLFAVAA